MHDGFLISGIRADVCVQELKGNEHVVGARNKDDVIGGDGSLGSLGGLLGGVLGGLLETLLCPNTWEKFANNLHHDVRLVEVPEIRRLLPSPVAPIFCAFIDISQV